MAFDPNNTLVRNPREAAKAFGGSGTHAVVPKQRHLFLVRFYMQGAQSGVAPGLLESVSFAAKMVERPKINPKVEELHQYNKKRQVYTGFRYEPLRMQIYDDHNSSALNMWQSYALYHFGDFKVSAQKDYSYDAIAANFLNTAGSGFGFTASGSDGASNWYFDRIEIYHFYHDLYDVYQLIHPRIATFDPDDLDYENSTIATISLSVAYENLQFSVQNAIGSGDAHGEDFAEFIKGATFDGDILDISDLNTAADNSASSVDPTSSAIDVNRLFASAPGATSEVIDYRYNGANSTGALGNFGNFTFGPNSQSSLANLALANPALAAALDLGSGVDPLTVTRNSVQGVLNTTAQRGLNGAEYDVQLAQALAVTSQYGGATDTITGSLLATNGKAVAGPDGITLSPQGYGSINAQQTGTAQYGVRADQPSDGSIAGIDTETSSVLGIA